MAKKLIGIVVLVIIVVILVISISKKDTAPNDLIEVSKIGAIMPLSGPAGNIGEGLKRALDMAELESMEIVYADDECNTAKAVSAYNTLKLQGIKIYSVACSGSVMALAPLAKADNNLIVTGYAGSSEIRKTGDEVIRFDPDAVSVVNALIKELSAEEWSDKRLAIIHEKQHYAQSAADILKEEFGGRIVAVETYLPADLSMKTQITKLKSSGADAIVYIPVSDKAADIVLKEMRDLGIPQSVVGEVNLCGFTSNPADFGLHGFCLNQKIATEGAEKFEADYLSKYGIASQYLVNDGTSYDAVKIVDRLISDGVDTISGLKSEILKGIEGDLMTYEFEPNGEVIDKGYFVKKILTGKWGEFRL